jgi:hypothetical protein
MKEFFLFCSGANLDVLKRCPTDESKYVGIGLTILLTAILASLTGGYALFTVFRSVPMAVVFGALWGVVIFNLDRVIVSGMRKQKSLRMDVLYALPRLAISLLLAVVISRPLELKLFEVEIEKQILRMQNDERRADVAVVQAGDGERVDELRRENARLNAEVENKRKEHKAAEDAWIREKEGTGGTGIPGAGPVFAEKAKALLEAERQMKDLEARNLPLIQQNNGRIASLVADQERRIAQTDSVRDKSNGFLARMQAFGALKKDDPTVYWAGLFITMLFVALEAAPVMVKLLSTLNPYRPYDDLLEQREIEIVEAAKQQVRVKRHELKDDADIEMNLTTDRNQLRVGAELRANEALIEQIASAQCEIAERLVEEWKQRELEKIEQGLGAYANSS